MRSERWWLMGTSLVILTAAWWTTFFPVLAFVALAPAIAWFMASVDGSADASPDPGHAERILLLFGLVFIGSAFVRGDSPFDAAVWAVGYASPFALFAFVRSSLGHRIGVLPLALAWMTVEYAFLKLQWPARQWFLADLLQEQGKWTLWFGTHGYLSASVWLLVTNLVAWAAFFRERRSLPFAVLLVVAVAVPVGIGYFLKPATEVIARVDMLDYYATGKATGLYADRGEWLARTAAWVTVLMLLIALVKSRTAKKENRKTK